MTTTAPVSTLIVDDEPPALTRLQNLLSQRTDIELVGTASHGAEAVALIRQLQPQLLFLDIQMPGLDGFGVLKQLPPAALPTTVFVTAYDRYAVAAFEAHAADYLLKPFSDDRFASALNRAVGAIRVGGLAERQLQLESVLAERTAVNAHSGQLERIVLKTSERVVLLNVDEIDWISAAGVYLELHTATATHLYRSSLTGLLARLNPARFVRIHRSAVVNTDRIKEFRPRGHSDYTVVLRDGTLVTLSRAYRAQIEDWLGQTL